MLRHSDIHRAPPDIVHRGLFKDDTLVAGTAASLLTREVDESAVGGNNSAFFLDSVFVELSDGRVTLRVG